MALNVTTFGVEIGEGSLSFGMFPFTVQSQLQRRPSTLAIERDGQRLRLGAPEAPVDQFLLDVCRWTETPGADAGLLLASALDDFGAHLASVLAPLEADESHDALSGALVQLCEFEHLDDVTLASAYLRFLRPDICSTLLTDVAAACDYDVAASDFATYSIVCRSIATRLTTSGIKNPVGRDGAWFPADVDLALIETCLHA